MWLFVGLGNPGVKYRWSRHNIGFIAVDCVVRELGLQWKEDRKVVSCIAEKDFNGEHLLFVKPLTYMNNSGIAVKKVLRKYESGIENLVVILDDMDLPWLVVRIRKKGSSGGHKGLESIIQELNTVNFCRVRIGIGRDPQIDPGEYVLGKFSNSEGKELTYLERGFPQIFYTMINEGIDKAMNKFNRKSLSEIGNG